MTDPQPDDEASVDLNTIIAPPAVLTSALCVACLAAGTTPPRELAQDQNGGYDSDAAAKHYVAKHELPTENVSQFVTDYRVADGHMTFQTRVITR